MVATSHFLKIDAEKLLVVLHMYAGSQTGNRVSSTVPSRQPSDGYKGIEKRRVLRIEHGTYVRNAGKHPCLVHAAPQRVDVGGRSAPHTPLRSRPSGLRTCRSPCILRNFACSERNCSISATVANFSSPLPCGQGAGAMFPGIRVAGADDSCHIPS